MSANETIILLMKFRVKFISSKDAKTFSTYTFRVMDAEKATRVARIDREKYDVVPIRIRRDEPIEMDVKIPALTIPSDLLLQFDRWSQMTFHIWVSREEYSFRGKENDSKKLKCCRYILKRIAVAV